MYAAQWHLSDHATRRFEFEPHVCLGIISLGIKKYLESKILKIRLIIKQQLFAF